MLASRGICVRSATILSPFFHKTQKPYHVAIQTFQLNFYGRVCGEGDIINGNPRNRDSADGDRYNKGRRICIDGFRNPLRCQSSRIFEESKSKGGNCIRMMTTNYNGGVANDKDAKSRLTALRLYRILQRLCGSLIPTTEGIILLQNDIAASDWGHYHFHKNGNNGDLMTEDQREELIRLFLVLSGADPVSGISNRSDWYNDLMSLIPNNIDKNISNRTCWSTPTNIRQAIRFAFQSSSSLSSQSPRELQALAVRAIQMIQDQAELWNQSSVSVTQNGLVRVTATSRCLGTVAPVSIAATYSPLTPKYRFAYRIRVENISSSATVQLLGRYWHIVEEPDTCDNEGSSPEPIEVDAPYTGAVGQLPVLQPGQVFEYVSGTDLTTPRGKMMGHLYMATVPPQTRSAKSGDDVTAVTCRGSKGSSSSSSSTGTATDDDNCKQTTLFQAIVKPFRLESFEN